MSRQHGADNEHHSRHPETTGDQGLLAAKAVDADVEEDGGCDDFDGAVDASGEHGRVRCAEADSLENLRSVAGGNISRSPKMQTSSMQNSLSNGVRAGELLPEHDDESDQEALAVAGCQAFLPGHAFSRVELFFDRCPDLSHLDENLGVVHGLASDVRQRGYSFVVATLLAKPSGTLLQEEETEEHDAAEHELD